MRKRRKEELIIRNGRAQLEDGFTACISGKQAATQEANRQAGRQDKQTATTRNRKQMMREEG